MLVVDDSSTMRMSLIKALNELGFDNIKEAKNGRQALELVRKESFDLMLLDMEMPEMNGMEVLIALKNDPQLGGLPVIVISGADQIENAVRCIEAGAEDYLPKPFNPTLLRARATSSIEKKRLRDLDRVQADSTAIREGQNGSGKQARYGAESDTRKPVYQAVKVSVAADFSVNL